MPALLVHVPEEALVLLFAATADVRVSAAGVESGSVGWSNHLAMIVAMVGIERRLLFVGELGGQRRNGRHIRGQVGGSLFRRSQIARDEALRSGNDIRLVLGVVRMAAGSGRTRTVTVPMSFRVASWGKGGRSSRLVRARQGAAVAILPCGSPVTTTGKVILWGS